MQQAQAAWRLCNWNLSVAWIASFYVGLCSTVPMSICKVFFAEPWDEGWLWILMHGSNQVQERVMRLLCGVILEPPRKWSNSYHFAPGHVSRGAFLGFYLRTTTNTSCRKPLKNFDVHMNATRSCELNLVLANGWAVVCSLPDTNPFVQNHRWCGKPNNT